MNMSVGAGSHASGTATFALSESDRSATVWQAKGKSSSRPVCHFGAADYFRVTVRVACPPKLLRTVMLCGFDGREN